MPLALAGGHIRLGDGDGGHRAWRGVGWGRGVFRDGCGVVRPAPIQFVIFYGRFVV